MRWRQIPNSKWWFRPLIYSVVALLICTSGIGVQYALGQKSAAEKAALESQAKADQYFASASSYRDLQKAISAAQALGLDVRIETALLAELATLLSIGSTETIQAKAVESLGTLQQRITTKEAETAAAEEDAKRYGTLKLTITNGAAANIDIWLGDQKTSATANDQGVLEQKLLTGTYNLVVSKSGYSDTEVKDVVITSLITTETSMTLSKIVTTSTATPKPTATPKTTTAPSTSSSTTYSSYRRTTVSSSRGTFTADIMEFQVGSGKVKVYTDTASDTDCTNDCPVISLKSYVDRYSNVVGAINGTYFCPADYASCATEKGSFFWKIRNPRLGVTINGGNGMGLYDPFLTFSSAGNPTYYDTWDSAPSVYAGINHKPVMVKNGTYVLDENDLDDKQRYTKSNRGAIGYQGSTVFAVIVASATVPDAAAVMDALGVDVALNLDGGGSSAMWYNGAYKKGPGRGLPNAIVFVEQ